jgi:uncharacterized protein (TIGR02145 family)
MRIFFAAIQAAPCRGTTVERRGAWRLLCLPVLFAALYAATLGDRSAAFESTFVDPRDGQTYATIEIVGQVWMKENLRFEIMGSYCYDNRVDLCARHGRWYDWGAANRACPPGWRLPTDEDWQTLLKAFNGGAPVDQRGDPHAFNALMKGGASGFDVLAAGWGAGVQRHFQKMDEIAMFWTSSSETEARGIYYLFNKNHGKVFRLNASKLFAGSCRCVRE